MKIKNVDEYYFHVADYIVFFTVTLGSTAVGYYLAFFKTKAQKEEESASEVKKDEVDEFLLGSRGMSVFPVAMSLIGTYISGVTLISTPNEIYNYGSSYMLVGLSVPISSMIAAFIYLPVFSTLQVGSSYEYLERRFHSNIRIFASILFVIDELVFLPFIAYTPGLAFAKFSGWYIDIITGVTAILTILYTLFGGMKAVVHTESWQVIVMYCSVVVIVILGFATLGAGKIIDRVNEGDRFSVDWTMSPYTKYSVFIVMLGTTTYWTCFNTVNQTMVQKYMSVPTLRKAQLAILIFTLGIDSFVILVLFIGVIMYAVFAKCHPASAGLVQKNDQMVPLLVMHLFGEYPGIAGFFLTGVFGAALSSYSAVLHSTAMVILEDFVKSAFKKAPSKRTELFIIKGSIIVLGIYSFLATQILKSIESIFAVATNATAIAASASFVLFTLGMLVPWCSTAAAVVGGATSAISCTIMAIGQHVRSNANKITFPKLPMDVSECPTNVTLIPVIDQDESGEFALFRVSYTLITPISVFFGLVTGLIASAILRQKVGELNADVISPILHRWLPDDCFASSNSKKPQKKTD